MTIFGNFLGKWQFLAFFWQSNGNFPEGQVWIKQGVMMSYLYTRLYELTASIHVSFANWETTNDFTQKWSTSWPIGDMAASTFGEGGILMGMKTPERINSPLITLENFISYILEAHVVSFQNSIIPHWCRTKTYLQDHSVNCMLCSAVTQI